MSERNVTVSNPHNSVRRLATVALTCLGISSFATGCGGAEITPLPVAQKDVATKVGQKFRAMSPMQKFVTSYIIPSSEGAMHEKRSLGDHKSIWGQDEHFRFRINTDCLDQTPYNPIQKSTETTTTDILGFATTSRSPSAEIPASLQIDADNTDQLIVHPSVQAANFSVLRLSGLNGTSLKPADAATQSVLDSWGCQTGILSAEAEIGGQHMYDIAVEPNIQP